MPYQTFLPFTLSQLSALLAVAPINTPIQFSKDNNNNVAIASTISNSALPTYLTDGLLPQMITQLTTAQNNKSIYFYKDNSGNLIQSNVENSTLSFPLGYQYQFINGDVVFTQVPITSNLNIPWNFTNTVLNDISLWSNLNTLWIDSK